MTRIAATAAAALLVLGSAGCANWELQRETVVLPIDALVHKAYPRALVAGDAEGIERIMGPKLAARLKADLLDGFSWLEGGYCFIHELKPLNDEGTRQEARCRLRVDGVAKDGFPHSVESEQTVEVEKGADGWPSVRDGSICSSPFPGRPPTR